jgi:hypothetical protein
VRADEFLHGLPEVAPEMPPVHHLQRLRRTGARGLGIGACTVPAQDFDLGVGGQPLGQWPGLPAVQHVDGAPGFQIHDDRGVPVPSAQREVVHRHHPHRTDRRFGLGPDQAQQGVLGRGHSGPGRQTRALTGGHRHRDSRQRLAQ